MLALIGGLALAQTAPCDDPPKEVVKCAADTKADANRQIDLSALLGGPPAAVEPGCKRTTVTVVDGSAVAVEDRLALVDAAFTKCATDARKRTQGLTGTARFDLTIDAQGRVTEVSTSASTLTDAQLAGCLERVYASAGFTPAARVVRIGVACSGP